MHPYIPYLLTDIAHAHRASRPSPFADNDDYSFQDSTSEVRDEQSLEKHFAEVEAFLSQDEPEHTFGYYCGMETIDFPPPEQLTDEEMKLVCKAFEKMMFSWNIDISLPDKLPVAIAYKMMVETLNAKTTIVSEGFIGFDYCTGNTSECEFKEYCPCLDFRCDDTFDKNEDISDDEKPY